MPVRAGAVLGVAVLILGCTPPASVRVYDEVVVLPSPVESLFEGSSASVISPYVWSVPAGWQAFAGDGIRLGTFEVTGRGATARTTIVSLEGDAGGVRANVVRWLDQLGLKLGDRDLDSLLDSAAPITTTAGVTLMVYDLTEFAATAAESTIGAIGSIGAQTLFVKMTGDAALLRRVRPSFEALVASVRRR